MNKRTWAAVVALLIVSALLLALPRPESLGQQQPPPPDRQPPGGPGGPGFGPPGGPGFGGPPGMGQERKIVKDFDKNGDGWLNKEERQAARDFLKKEPRGGGFG